MINGRPNSCSVFHYGRCLQQWDMEKVYLIPQLLGPRDLLKHQSICLSCEQYVEHKVFVSGWRIIDRRSCEDRRFGQGRRQSDPWKEQPTGHSIWL